MTHQMLEYNVHMELPNHITSLFISIIKSFYFVMVSRISYVYRFCNNSRTEFAKCNIMDYIMEHVHHLGTLKMVCGNEIFLAM